jgi:hypothetical protein
VASTISMSKPVARAACSPPDSSRPRPSVATM